MFELTQEQPFEFGVGYSAVRVWVNENGTPRVYFGKISNGAFPIGDSNPVIFDLCGVVDPATQEFSPILSGSSI